MSVRNRLVRLEAQAAFGQDVRKLSDAQLYAEIARLSARLGIAGLSPAEMVLFLKEVSADESAPAH